MYTEEFVPYLFHVTPGTFHELFVLVLTKCVKVGFGFFPPSQWLHLTQHFNPVSATDVRDVPLPRHILVVNTDKLEKMYFDFK